jgi:hypothetical protein
MIAKTSIMHAFLQTPAVGVTDLWALPGDLLHRPKAEARAKHLHGTNPKFDMNLSSRNSNEPDEKNQLSASQLFVLAVIFQMRARII